VVVVDANTLKLATSQANALANVTISLGTNGTGTQTINLGTLLGGQWLVRDGTPQQWAGNGSPEGVVTAAVGSTYVRVDGGPSTFFVKGSGSGNTGWLPNGTVMIPLGTATRLTNCSYAAMSGTSSGLDGDDGWVTSTAASWEYTSQDHSAWALRVGDRIKSVRLVSKTVAGTHNVNLYKIAAAGGSSGTVTLVASWSTGLSGNDETLTVSSPVAIATGERWFLDISGTTSGHVLTHVEVGYDHP
jgi:hypothetical protein